MFTKLAENHIAFFFFLYLISTFLFYFIFQKLFHFKKQLCPMCKLGTPFQSKLNWPSDLWRNLLSIILKNPLKINNTFIFIIFKKSSLVNKGYPFLVPLKLPSINLPSPKKAYPISFPHLPIFILQPKPKNNQYYY